MNFDLVVIGSGPGGYVAAIRASQLGMKVAVVEKAELGGICLNWGCIPTKSLLKSASVYEYITHANEYGIKIIGEVKPDFLGMINRSRSVADGMSKGIQFLFKKNKIEVVPGVGKIIRKDLVEVTDVDGLKHELNAKHIILATGARSKELPSLPQDGERIIGYRKAMILEKQPASMVVVGSGAIGSEFAYFYNSIGTKVILVEYLDNVVPLEDEEVSKQLGRSFKKSGIEVMTGSEVTKVDKSGKLLKVTVKDKKGSEKIIESEIVLSAVGITPNIEGLGLEDVGVVIDNGRVTVDSYYRTNVDGIYAIGDIIAGPALAHVASAEGIICVEKIAGYAPEPLDYDNIPACTYTTPEVASLGLTEKVAKEKGYELKIGKFPFTASGKASAAGQKDGFVKLIFDTKYGELLGAHLIGANVTEMIAELVTARKLETTGHEIIKAIHPHPTMSEAIMEAAAAAYGEVIHI
ncbi:MAG: dihydrolipoyl dehydrogenase [Marinilabiliaceae bacterium]|nr:dihydrolipoyl dehydrogenase [Marinilabiliaceae bacterium]